MRVQGGLSKESEPCFMGYGVPSLMQGYTVLGIAQGFRFLALSGSILFCLYDDAIAVFQKNPQVFRFLEPTSDTLNP